MICKTNKDIIIINFLQKNWIVIIKNPGVKPGFL